MFFIYFVFQTLAVDFEAGFVKKPRPNLNEEAEFPLLKYVTNASSQCLFSENQKFNLIKT
jgi:hypothetical protein